MSRNLTQFLSVFANPYGSTVDYSKGLGAIFVSSSKKDNFYFAKYTSLQYLRFAGQFLLRSYGTCAKMSW